jgi:hypothetical protein
MALRDKKAKINAGISHQSEIPAFYKSKEVCRDMIFINWKLLG